MTFEKRSTGGIAGDHLVAESHFAFAVIERDDPYWVEVYDAEEPDPVFAVGCRTLTEACRAARHLLEEANDTFARSC